MTGAVTLYPNGKKDQYKDYISLYIRLKSEKTDVNALFELMLVDQSGKVGVLAIQTKMENPPPSAFVPYRSTSLVDDQGMKESNFEVTTLPHLGSAEKIINTFSSQLQLQELIYDGRSTFAEYLNAVDEIQQSTKSGMIYSYETEERAIKTLQSVFKGILTFSISGTESNTMNSTVYSSSVASSSSYELQGSSRIGQGEISSEQAYRLRSIVEKLNSTECLGDCIEVYKISRKSAVDARFRRFGIGKWSINDLRFGLGRIHCKS
ncbi:hypothetical protein POM88_033985 [Heracleum sosnowskyi]|uniref:Uncharacterized protein n=1 Tax=Heracleum sosnowskyi TaxID=360622 RepID=A0AAD8MD61_9APIA|nr:hypothetical protein POM88_033985 [Heracleum sosnowskyi]